MAASVSKRAVVDLRAFFDDLAVWGWAERPPGRLLHPGDVPRLDRTGRRPVRSRPITTVT